jgi:hypothetical protein
MRLGGSDECSLEDCGQHGHPSAYTSDRQRRTMQQSALPVPYLYARFPPSAILAVSNTSDRPDERSYTRCDVQQSDELTSNTNDKMLSLLADSEPVVYHPTYVTRISYLPALASLRVSSCSDPSNHTFNFMLLLS